MNKLLRLLMRRHEPDTVALSSLIDGQLEPAWGRRLETHVTSCAACADVLAGLREARLLVRSVPLAEVPRSFRLRVADAGALNPASGRGYGALRWSPVLAAAAAVVFVGVLASDLATRGSGSAPLASLQSEQRTGTIADEGAGFSPGNETAGAPAPPQPGAGVARPPDAGTSVASAPAAGATEAPAEGPPTPAATQPPTEALLPADGATDAATPPETGGGAPGPVSGTEPAGAAPDGDESVPAPGVQPPAVPSTVAGDAAARPAPQPWPTAAGELSALASDNEGGGQGNRWGFRVVEIGAAITALAAGGVFGASRLRRRGES